MQDLKLEHWRELWRELCAQEIKEPDPAILRALIEQIDQLLEEREPRPALPPELSKKVTLMPPRRSPYPKFRY
jgi:hypothetical protein